MCHTDMWLVKFEVFEVRKHFLQKIGLANSNLVAVLILDFWAMAVNYGTVF